MNVDTSATFCRYARHSLILILILLFAGCGTPDQRVTQPPIKHNTPTLQPPTVPSATTTSTDVEQGATADALKQQFIATEQVLEATARTFPTPTASVWHPSPLPTPTIAVGLRDPKTCSGSYRELAQSSCGVFLINNHYVLVNAGAAPAHERQGLIHVLTNGPGQPPFSHEAFFPTPTEVGGVSIAQFDGSRFLTLIAGPGDVFVFDLVTQTWIASGACQLYPVALPSSVSRANNGDELDNILQGLGNDQFGWLSWTGTHTRDVLAESLTPPGDSSTYTNPEQPDDHHLSTGDWVMGNPDKPTSDRVHQAIEQLMASHQVIVVPIWDRLEGQGNTLRYHISDFAWVRLVNYTQDQLSVIYTAPAHCLP